MDTFQNLNTPNRSRFGVFKLSKPKRLKSRHGLPDTISEGAFVYRALSELEADGAWGTWLGEQREAGGACQPVLLKHTGESNRTRAGAEALWLEALLTLKLDGPHVVPLVDYGVLDGRPFAIYGFEEGVFLAQVIEGLRERNRRLPSGVAVGIILQACELVRKLHKLSLGDDEAPGFVHGSLCPRNFLLTERGDVKVMGLIGVRPVGRIVGREHVPPAAMAYASPDLLGGAPVTPAVDVHSLGSVLQELIGAGPVEGEVDDLGRIVRDLLAQGPGAGFANVDAFAGALQDAVRRTGTVVARQSIGAQVRGVCEQYLLERRRQVRALREVEWSEQREPTSSRPAAAEGAGSSGGLPGAGALSPDELELAAASEDPAELGAYHEETGDDAVTRIYDGQDIESDGAAQPQAWMHDSRPAEAARAGWTRWAVVALLGVLVMVASGAAVMAVRSDPRPQQQQVAAAPAVPSKPVAPSAATAAPKPAEAVTQPAAEATLATVHGASAANDTMAEGEGAGDVAAAPEEPEGRKLTRPRTAKERIAARKAVAKRRAALAARRAAAKVGSTQPARSEPVAEASDQPATVGVGDLPEAEEEPEPAESDDEAAAEAEGDLVIEDEAPKMAFLSVDASPYATVFIDGQKKGVTPLLGLELSPGLHRMVARTEDGRTKRFTLQLESGKTETVKLSFEE